MFISIFDVLSRDWRRILTRKAGGFAPEGNPDWCAGQGS
jgi:hypothetical protein